jgi:outer membrane lipoprotein-sorting protein
VPDSSLEYGRSASGSGASQREPRILGSVESPGIVARHPALRWGVPLGIVGLAVVVVVVTSGVLTGRSSSQSLPQTVPVALVSAVQDSRDTGFSGTVVSHVSLGVPTLASLPALSGMDEDTSFSSLLAGSHTMQVWYGGADKQRVALLGATEETDLFRNGRNLWKWSSADGVAVHTVLAGATAASAADGLPADALTPAALADGALDALDANTELSTADTVTVADRPAYDLVLTPHSARTKIASVHVAIDGATKVPLGVQVYARGSSNAAIDVAFTSIRFGEPAERNFQFAPPPNARVIEVVHHAASRYAASLVPVLGGAGWTTVYRLAPVARAATGSDVAAEFRTMPTVSGHWGKGRLIETDLLSVLVMNDGRVYAGPVRPQRLYAAAGRGVR